MDFTEDPDHRLIRAAVREICAQFPDEYRFSNAGSGPVRGVPETGEHTKDVLAEWAGRPD